jgi:hypothetical protein
MFLVLDTDGDLAIYKSVVAAEANLETIDIENRESEFCDETGHAYAGEVLRPTSALISGRFRLVPSGSPKSRFTAGVCEPSEAFFKLRSESGKPRRCELLLLSSKVPTTPSSATAERGALAVERRQGQDGRRRGDGPQQRMVPRCGCRIVKALLAGAAPPTTNCQQYAKSQCSPYPERAIDAG